MSTITEQRPTASPSDTDDAIVHLYCECDPNISLCGIDVTDDPEYPSAEASCVVCIDLDEWVCERCDT